MSTPVAETSAVSPVELVRAVGNCPLFEHFAEDTAGPAVIEERSFDFKKPYVFTGLAA